MDPTDVVLRIEDNDAPLITPVPTRKKRRGGRDDHAGEDSNIQFQALESGFKKQQGGFWVSLQENVTFYYHNF